MEMIDIDCLGDFCPVPLLKFKKHQSEINKDITIKLVTDHSCVCESIKTYCKTLKYHVEIEEPINGVWELYISLP